MAIFSILTHPSLITPLLPPNHPFQGQSSKIKLAHTSSHPILSSAYFPRGSMPTLSQNLLLSSSPVTSVLPNPLDSLPSQSFSDSLGIFDPVDPSFLKECPPLVWGTSHTLSVFFSFPLSRHHAGPFPGSFYLLPAVYAILRPPFFLTNTTPALFRSANCPAKKTRFSGLTWSWEDMYSDRSETPRCVFFWFSTHGQGRGVLQLLQKSFSKVRIESAVSPPSSRGLGMLLHSGCT